MGANTPEALDTLFCAALNRNDLDALVALYEPNASLMPSPGKVVTGTAAIREALAGFIAAKPHMTLAARVLTRAGDIALVSSNWQLSFTGSDGKPVEMRSQSVEVMRCQDNGEWRFAIDFPFGAMPAS